jgi:hypothetical protein
MHHFKIGWRILEQINDDISFRSVRKIIGSSVQWLSYGLGEGRG